MKRIVITLALALLQALPSMAQRDQLIIRGMQDLMG